MTTPEQLLTDFLKDIIKTTSQGGDPMQRRDLVKGYAKHLEAMLKQAELRGYNKALADKEVVEDEQVAAA